MLQSIRNLFCRPHDNLSVSPKLVSYAAWARDNAAYNLIDYELCVGELREDFRMEVLVPLQKKLQDLETIHRLILARKSLGSSALQPDERKFLREHLHLLRFTERRTLREPGPRLHTQDETTGPDAQKATEDLRIMPRLPAIPPHHVIGRYR